MNRFVPITAAVAATLCLGTAHAQTQPSPATQPPATQPPPAAPNGGQTQENSNPDAASSPHQRAATGQQGTPESNPSTGANPAAASTPHQRSALSTGKSGVTAGTRVRSPSGEAIGTVRDIVPNSKTGHADYVLVDTTAGRTTAVPAHVIDTSVQNGKVIMDRARLEAAPVVSTHEVQDPSNTSWRTKADQYWRQGAQPSSNDRG